MTKKKHVFFQPVQTAEQRRKRTRNIVITAVILVIAAVAIYFAMPKNKDLSQSSIFDQAEIEALARQAVNYINEEDFEGLKAMSVDEMSSIMNQERMDEAKARVSEDWGAFQEVSDITAMEVTQRGVTAAVAYVTADYENAEIHFTFAFNEDMKLASLGIQ
ncbi:MAG TPA: DUF3887 domain-containing protein [Candidatus Mediterraneibacter faecavium]|uniref:DUF3887 domain-containing protein n=1 Tax=Candidatus Mediterraneibacter faecavium TaxID=2838668 RepID=A0A9D2Q6T0_9FIRM|nr:DUF3887 domain-containing protein [Candidatus Mediterraneibacter faecavium]